MVAGTRSGSSEKIFKYFEWRANRVFWPIEGGIWEKKRIKLLELSNCEKGVLSNSYGENNISKILLYHYERWSHKMFIWVQIKYAICLVFATPFSLFTHPFLILTIYWGSWRPGGLSWDTRQMNDGAQLQTQQLSGHQKKCFFQNSTFIWKLVF